MNLLFTGGYKKEKVWFVENKERVGEASGFIKTAELKQQRSWHWYYFIKNGSFGLKTPLENSLDNLSGTPNLAKKSSIEGYF